MRSFKLKKNNRRNRGGSFLGETIEDRRLLTSYPPSINLASYAVEEDGSLTIEVAQASITASEPVRTVYLMREASGNSTLQTDEDQFLDVDLGADDFRFSLDRGSWEATSDDELYLTPVDVDGDVGPYYTIELPDCIDEPRGCDSGGTSDPPLPSWVKVRALETDVLEGKTAVVTLEAEFPSGTSPEHVAVTYEFLDGTALQSTGDYSAPTDDLEVLLYPVSGENVARAYVSTDTLTDDVHDDGEHFSVKVLDARLTDGTGAPTVTIVDAIGEITINEPPYIYLDPSTTTNTYVSVTEGDSDHNLQFHVRLTKSVDYAITGTLATVDGSINDDELPLAADPSDYYLTSGSFTIPAGQTSSDAVDVTIVGDNVIDAENFEYFTVEIDTFSGPTGNYDEEAQRDWVRDHAVVEIDDDDDPPTGPVTVSIRNETNGKEEKESDSVRTFRITPSRILTGNETVTVNFATAIGTATTSDNDFTGKIASVTLSSSTPYIDVDVTVIDDDRPELNEYFLGTISIGSTNNVVASLGNDRSRANIINDDMYADAALVSIDPASVADEGAGARKVMVSLSKALDQAISGTVSAFPGIPGEGDVAEASGADYSYVGSYTIPAGEKYTYDVEWTPVDDSLDKSHVNEDILEFFYLRLTSLYVDRSIAKVDRNNDTHQARIIDNDEYSDPEEYDKKYPIKVSISDAEQVTEGDPGDPTVYSEFTVELSRSVSSGKELIVHWKTEDGTALSGDDYEAKHGQTLTFTSSSGTTAVVQVPIVHDDEVENDFEAEEDGNIEHFYAVIESLSGSQTAEEIIGEDKGRAEIEDDDYDIDPPDGTEEPYLGAEFVRDRETREPDAGRLKAVLGHARGAGVLMSSDGPADNVLKIKPPIVFDRHDADLMLGVLAHALEATVT